jgi:predicted transcriptional regulator
MSKTMRKKKDPVKELAQEIEILDHMLSALVETLEEKGIMTTEEWEAKIKEKIEHVAKNYISFRDLKS